LLPVLDMHLAVGLDEQCGTFRQHVERPSHEHVNRDRSAAKNSSRSPYSYASRSPPWLGFKMRGSRRGASRRMRSTTTAVVVQPQCRGDIPVVIESSVAGVLDGDDRLDRSTL
jgi:hypothetical protein